jgi:hypothetical protein
MQPFVLVGEWILRGDRSLGGAVAVDRDVPPTVAVSRLINSLKGVSSRRLRQEFPDLARHDWRARRRWSGSYFAGSVGGARLSVLRASIDQQRRPHDAIHLRPQGRSLSRKSGSS